MFMTIYFIQLKNLFRQGLTCLVFSENIISQYTKSVQTHMHSQQDGKDNAGNGTHDDGNHYQDEEYDERKAIHFTSLFW